MKTIVLPGPPTYDEVIRVDLDRQRRLADGERHPLIAARTPPRGGCGTMWPAIVYGVVIYGLFSFLGILYAITGAMDIPPSK